MSDCIGMKAHEWQLAIEEGQVSVTTERCGELCAFASLISDGTACLDGDSMDFLEMPALTVDVRMATDCPAYDTDEHNIPTGPPLRMSGYESGSHYIVHGSRCDCNWWPVVLPKPTKEQDNGSTKEPAHDSEADPAGDEPAPGAS